MEGWLNQIGTDGDGECSEVQQGRNQGSCGTKFVQEKGSWGRVLSKGVAPTRGMNPCGRT